MGQRRNQKANYNVFWAKWNKIQQTESCGMQLKLPNEAAIPFLGMYLRELKTSLGPYKNICISYNSIYIKF